MEFAGSELKMKPRATIDRQTTFSARTGEIITLNHRSLPCQELYPLNLQNDNLHALVLNGGILMALIGPPRLTKSTGLLGLGTVLTNQVEFPQAQIVTNRLVNRLYILYLIVSDRVARHLSNDG